MLTIEITRNSAGIPEKKSLQKEQKAKEMYDIGRESAIAEVKQSSADVKHAVADMYSALIIAQAKALLNNTLVDIARTLGEVKAQGSFLQGLIQQMGQQPPSLSPYVGTPAMGIPPLPAETQDTINNVGIPPLPPDVGTPATAGMPTPALANNNMTLPTAGAPPMPMGGPPLPSGNPMG